MRIDNLLSGDEATLDFGGNYTESSTFVRFVNPGDTDRRAVFSFGNSVADSNDWQWEAYRYEGMWAYGTSAERLRLVCVRRAGTVVYDARTTQLGRS